MTLGSAVVNLLTAESMEGSEGGMDGGRARERERRREGEKEGGLTGRAYSHQAVPKDVRPSLLSLSPAPGLSPHRFAR